MTTIAKAGRYEIQGELGRGAMGVVYKASDPVIGRTVAVKTLKLSEQGTGLSHSELLARFQTEARAAGILTHTNIVVVYDAGEEDGLFYITMELVEGKSLQTLLDAGQSFPLPRILRIMEQTCGALQFAHERSIVHRDIKPANIMMTADDTVKITDFGTAKILQFGTVQQTAHVMGTPSYMSPEQVKGKVVDGRSDIFSLGVMLYEMVTGEKPFPGQNITTVIYKIVNEDPVPPRTIDPSIHPGLSAVVLKALAKDPDQRYQSCREMMEDLKNYRNLTPAAGPESTIASKASAEATVVMAPVRAVPMEDTSAAARSLNHRASGPGQTPAIRRTGAIAPIPEAPKKSNTFVSVLAGIFLVGVIILGAMQIRPVFEDARERNRFQDAQAKLEKKAEQQHAAATESQPETKSETRPEVKNGATSEPVTKPEAVAPENHEPKPIEKKPLEVVPTPATLKSAEPGLNPSAARFKARIEESAAPSGLARKLRIHGAANTLTFSGKLLPAEHAELLKILKTAPAGVQVVDDIQQYVQAASPVAAAQNNAPPTGAKPASEPGVGAIWVTVNVPGAIAMIPATGGEPAQQCQTPCSFTRLFPGEYNLEVKKAGYQPMQTALQVRGGEVLEQRISLEPGSVGLRVVSSPAGAEVFINGAKQSGRTPVTLPLAPGHYNIVVRRDGYTAYFNTVTVTDGPTTEVAVELAKR